MEYEDKLDFILEKTKKEFVVFEGEEFYKSLIGFAVLPEGEIRLAYNKEILFNELEKQGMEGEEVLEHYYYNILGLGLSEGTPIFCNGSWDDLSRHYELEEDEHEFVMQLIEEDKEDIIYSEADSFEYDYLICYDEEKRKASNIEVESFPYHSAFIIKV